MKNSNINDFGIKDLSIGMSKQFNVTITDGMLNEFAKISGDFNPLHMDEEYAKSTKFGKRISHGMLLASFLSKLVGMYLPGKNSLYLSQTLKFPSPCYINDEVIIKGEIISKSENTGIINILTQISSTEGKLLVKGEAKVLVRN